MVFFTYQLGDNKLQVEATVIDEGRDAIMPSLDSPGEPADEGEIEIDDVYLVDEDGDLHDFHTDGVFIRPWGKTECRSLLDALEEAAWEAVGDQ